MFGVFGPVLRYAEHFLPKPVSCQCVFNTFHQNQFSVNDHNQFLVNVSINVCTTLAARIFNFPMCVETGCQNQFFNQCVEHCQN
jgi:hypothetical protein